jgi:predicted patatin/cPLA2 family phospholipase
MGINGMSRFLRWFFATLFALVLGILGMERKKNQKKDVVIKEQKSKNFLNEKQAKVYKLNIEELTSTANKLEEVERKQQIEEQKIVEAESNEEIIDVANHLVANFNRVSNDSKK